MRCSSCGKEMPAQDLAFCPYCGMKLETAAETEKSAANAGTAGVMDDKTRSAMMRDLLKAQQETNLYKRKELLLKLRGCYPDCFEVEQELLFIGNPRRNKKNAVDYFIIKCYLLDIYLHPGNFTDEIRSSCREEIFGDEQLARCAALSGKGEGYTEEYLKRLCGEYVSLFLQGSAEYGRGFFGLFRDRHPEQTLAVPVGTILANISADGQLSPEHRAMLSRCMYEAFSGTVNGKTLHLDAKLAEAGIPVYK
ncbi:MAG: hypothetical protein CW338_09090 [Clostridiales bacterium]|nr:hypothetical protein [Clostridiales bacterium]